MRVNQPETLTQNLTPQGALTLSPLGSSVKFQRLFAPTLSAADLTISGAD